MLDLFLYHEKHKVFKIEDTVTNNNVSYLIDERIRSGGNGVVHKCINEATGDEYAIKFLLRTDAAKRSEKRFKRECSVLAECSHPHIISHICSGNVNSEWKKPQQNRIYNKKLHYLIMELSDTGDLMKQTLKQKTFEPEIYHAQFRGLVDALCLMHNKNIVHRDIKPQNVLIVGEKWVLSDFGLASIRSAPKFEITGDREQIGPRFWMSPEAINRSIGLKGTKAKISKSSDVFQLASFFWFAVAKSHPSGILNIKDWPGKKSVYKVLCNALKQNHNRRYKDALEFAGDLVDAIEI